jgi:hypothetical protein
MSMLSSSFDTGRLPAASLPASPEPYCDESPLSWIVRICGAHQYSDSIWARLTGFSPALFDWDRHHDANVWRLICAAAWQPVTACRTAINVFGACTQTQALMTTEPGYARYAWCPYCFAQDKHPYLRWQWRMRIALRCPVHQSPLAYRCTCGTPLVVRNSVLTGGRINSTSRLDQCVYCDANLASVKPTTRDLRGLSDSVLYRSRLSQPSSEHINKDAPISSRGAHFMTPVARRCSACAEPKDTCWPLCHFLMSSGLAPACESFSKLLAWERHCNER